jgi:hypothetical protein
MNFETFKNMSVWELIKFLESETKVNARKVKENSLLVVRNLNARNHGEAQKFQKINQKLVKTNDGYIKLHNALLGFFMERKGLQEPVRQTSFAMDLPVIMENKIQLDFDEFLSKTLKGELAYNDSHPFFCSDEFRDKLLEYYISIEDYEMCDNITKGDMCP